MKYVLTSIFEVVCIHSFIHSFVRQEVCRSLAEKKIYDIPQGGTGLDGGGWALEFSHFSTVVLKSGILRIQTGSPL
jgi:hypothetical protein